MKLSMEKCFLAAVILLALLVLLSLTGCTPVIPQPEAEVSGLISGATTNSTIVQLRLTVSDNTDLPMSCDLTLDGVHKWNGSLANEEIREVIVTIESTPGAQTFTLTCTDEFSNVGVSEPYVLYYNDGIAPVPRILDF